MSSLTGGSLNKNPPNADRHITVGGTDWLWAVFAVMAVSTLGMIIWSTRVSICPFIYLFRLEAHLCLVLSVHEAHVSFTILRSSSSPRRRWRISRWRLTSVLHPSLQSSLAVILALARSGYVCSLDLEANQTMLTYVALVCPLHPMVHHLPSPPHVIALLHRPCSLRHPHHRVLRMDRRRVRTRRSPHLEHLQVGILRPWRRRAHVHLVRTSPHSHFSAPPANMTFSAP